MEEMPKESSGRTTVAVGGEALLNLVPVVGSSLGYVFGAAMRRKHEDNLSAWLEDLGRAVNDLQMNVDQLAADEEFVETLIDAATVASRTARGEKLRALRNAVLNSTDADERPEDDLRPRFLAAIDQMVPAHLRLLTYCASPRAWFETRKEGSTSSMATPLGLASEAMGWGKSEEARLQRLLEDLVAWRLVGASITDTINGTRDGLLDRIFTTPDGTKFIQFVSDPARESVD